MSAPSAIARRWQFDSAILSLAINRRGNWIAASTAHGSVILLPADDAGEDPQVLQVHEGVSLSLAQDADAHAFLSGGDDGKLYLVEPGVPAPTLLAEHKGRWIDHAAGEASGHRAYASGKTLYRLNEEGQESAPPLAMPSSIGGLCFSPNGKRLAVSHYNGVSLFWANAPETAPEVLEWKGSHLNMIWHPEGQIILSALQDNALHGWKLGPGLKNAEPGHEMQMQGYAGKIRSMAFSAKARYLATSGADQVVCWPFFDGGPWEKAPLMLGGTDGRQVLQVAPHPRDDLVATGYDDGMIVLAPLDGRMEVMIHPPLAPKGAAVRGLVWDAAGQSLMAAFESGTLLLFTLASITRSVRGQHR